MYDDSCTKNFFGGSSVDIDVIQTVFLRGRVFEKAGICFGLVLTSPFRNEISLPLMGREGVGGDKLSNSDLEPVPHPNPPHRGEG